MSNVIGYVSKQTGNATLTKINGEVVELGIFSQIDKNDLIESSDGAQLEIVMSNGNVVTIDGQRTVMIDETIYEKKAFDADDVSVKDVNAIEDGDISKLDDTEAGDNVVGTSENIGDAYIGSGEDHGNAFAKGLGSENVRISGVNRYDPLEEGLSQNTIFATAVGNETVNPIDTSYGDDTNNDGLITPPSVEIVDENNDGVINSGELGTSDIIGNIGEGGATLDSLIITSSGGGEVVVDVSTVTINPDGSYNVDDVDLSGLGDGNVTVTATSTDTDGNSTTVTNETDITIDTSYGNDTNDDGSITPPSVEIVDEDGVLNANETEATVITGNIGEGGTSLDSLIITSTGGGEVVVDVSTVTINPDGSYTVEVDVSDLGDGNVTVTATSTDEDGNSTTVTNATDITIDTSYGNDGDDTGSDVTPASVALVDENNDGVINSGELGTSDIIGNIGEGGATLDSLIITSSGGGEVVVDVSTVTINPDGSYNVDDVDLSGLGDGNVTVTATSTDTDGNSTTVTNETDITIDTSYGNDTNDDGSITPPSVEIVDEDGVLNANETEATVITGNIGEGGTSLDSLIITSTGGGEVVVDVSTVTINPDGSYTVEVDVSDLGDGNVTVTATSTDEDGNSTTVTNATDITIDASVDDNNGTGTGIDGADAVVSLDEISDHYINAIEVGEGISITGTTTLLAGGIVRVVFNGETYTAEAIGDDTSGIENTFTVRVPADKLAVLADAEYSVIATVVADQAGNIASDSALVTVDTSAGIATDDNSGLIDVFESDLSTGTSPSDEAPSTSGNLLGNDEDTTGSTISSISIGDTEGTPWSENPDILVLDTPSGIIYVASSETTYDGVDYNAGDYVYTLEDASAAESEMITYTLTDPAGNSSSADLIINIADDVPVGSSVDKYINADSSYTNTTNLVLTVDVSGSMGELVEDDTTRLDLAKEALNNLIDEYAEKGNVNIKVITFSNTVSESVWLSVSDAKSLISSLDEGGRTYYDDAIARVESIDYSADDYSEADDSFFYFISDGVPYPNSHALTNNEISSWNTYAEANFDTAFAVGIGTSSDSLTAIGGDNTISIDSATDLDAALLSTVADITGNLILSDSDGTVIDLGADGGRIESLEIDGNTYSYDDYNNVDITTDLEGVFNINFDTGEYTYSNEIQDDLDAVEVVNVVSIQNSQGEIEAVSDAELMLHLHESIEYTGEAVIGDEGVNTLVLSGSDSINFDNISSITSIEAIDLNVGGDHSLENISASDVFNMTDDNHDLTIFGDAGDNVTLANPSEWVASTSSENGHDFNVYTSLDNDQITLKIETDIPVV